MSELVISVYEKNQLRSLALEAEEHLREWGSNSNPIERAMDKAYRMGFSAVSRGEANIPHPVMNDDADEVSQPEAALDERIASKEQ